MLNENAFVEFLFDCPCFEHIKNSFLVIVFENLKSILEFKKFNLIKLSK